MKAKMTGRGRSKTNPALGGFAAAAKAGQMQRIREAEQNSKRRGLVLPQPQVGEGELENIIKMGMSGERAHQLSRADDSDATKALVGDYSGMIGATPSRTPRAPKEEDRIANEIRNARARTETQSALLGGDNTPIHEGEATTGYGGVMPSKQQLRTPNPLATPRANGTPSLGMTPMRSSTGPGATPLRTPRDSFRLNQADQYTVQQSPRELKLAKSSLRDRLAGLPKPKETDFELELPEEQQVSNQIEMTEEDAAERDRRSTEAREAAERAEWRRQSQVVQKGLPRPSVIDTDTLVSQASSQQDPAEKEIAREMALLIMNDATKFGSAKVSGSVVAPLERFDDDDLQRARMEVALEISADEARRDEGRFEEAWRFMHKSALLPGLAGYGEDDVDEGQLMVEAFDVSSSPSPEGCWSELKAYQNIQSTIEASTSRGNALEKKLALHLGGYQNRAKTLRQKIIEAAEEALEKTRVELDTHRTAQLLEESAIARRLEYLREEVTIIGRREREAQDLYRARKEELDDVGKPNVVNGWHGAA